MDKNKLEEKIKQVEEQMQKLTLEKDNVIKVKDDKIDELKEIMLRQEQYMRSLGINLEEVKDQNEELLDETRELKSDVRKVQHKLGIAVEDRAPLPKDVSKQDSGASPALRKPVPNGLFY